MTEKELLESAAKAAGISLIWHDGIPKNTTGFHPAMNIYAAKTWNPLIDDGDALRLAVLLRIHIMQFGNMTTAQPHLPSQIGFVGFDERHDSDSCAATRRAIVRGAAEMGKSIE